jgi:hypothetical protein
MFDFITVSAKVLHLHPLRGLSLTHHNPLSTLILSAGIDLIHPRLRLKSSAGTFTTPPKLRGSTPRFKLTSALSLPQTFASVATDGRFALHSAFDGGFLSLSVGGPARGVDCDVVLDRITASLHRGHSLLGGTFFPRWAGCGASSREAAQPRTPAGFRSAGARMRRPQRSPQL